MNDYKLTNGKLKAGQAMSTTGGKLRFKRIIHVVGPT